MTRNRALVATILVALTVLAVLNSGRRQASPDITPTDPTPPIQVSNIKIPVPVAQEDTEEEEEEHPQEDVIVNATGRVAVPGPGGDSNKETYGTAFLYSRKDLAVTCLHVVGDAEEVRIVFPGGRRTAKLKKTLRAHDLALLELESPVEATPLTSRSLRAKERPRLTAYGSRFGNTVLSTVDTPLRKIGGRRLSDLIVNDDMRKLIKDVGCPDLDSEILDLEAALVPGISGGPVYDERKVVVGICNGGLEKGATNTSWGIPASKLDRLLASEEDILEASTGVARSDLAFSTITREEASTPPIKIGRHTLRKVRTRKLGDLMQYSDSPVGLAQLANQFAGFQPHNWEYDIYQDVESGASLTLPKGQRPRINGGVMEYRFPTGIVLGISISRAANQMERDAQFQAFGNRYCLLQEGTSWEFLPAWSYVAPTIFPNGLYVNRLAFLKCRPKWNPAFNAPYLDSYGKIPRLQDGTPDAEWLQYFFVTFAEYRGATLCVGAFRPSLLQFGRGGAEDLDWGKAVMTVHLANFPGEGPSAAR